LSKIGARRHQWRRRAEQELPGSAETIAATPGQVIFRNELMELIQYSSATPDVLAEPVLIVPAWIMKYYVLDLAPQRSLVRYLVDRHHGIHDVLAQPNPCRSRHHLRCLPHAGVMAALAAINAVVPDRKIHACGYCLGGTMLAIAAATMAREGDDRLKTVTLLAAQTDFSGRRTDAVRGRKPDRVSRRYDVGSGRARFIANERRIQRAAQRRSGVVEMTRRYLLGEREPMNDLLAWNATDPLALSHASQYLRGLFWRTGSRWPFFSVEGNVVALKDLRIPMFVVGPSRSHRTLAIGLQGSPFYRHRVDLRIDQRRPQRRYRLRAGSPGPPLRYRHPPCRRPLRGCGDLAFACDAHRGSWWPEWNPGSLPQRRSAHRSASDRSRGARHRAHLSGAGTYVLQR